MREVKQEKHGSAAAAVPGAADSGGSRPPRTHPSSPEAQVRASGRRHSPQLPVQRLNHRGKAPAGLVKVGVAGPQALAHGLLAGQTQRGRVSVEASGSDRAGGSAGLL